MMRVVCEAVLAAALFVGVIFGLFVLFTAMNACTPVIHINSVFAAPNTCPTEAR